MPVFRVFVNRLGMIYDESKTSILYAEDINAICDWIIELYTTSVSADNELTLENKRITKRSESATSSATPHINTDTTDYYEISALAHNITSLTTNLSGTPVRADTLWLSFTDNGTARSLALGSGFEPSGTVALPTTTVAGVRLDLRFVWNDVTNKWRCIGTA